MAEEQNVNLMEALNQYLSTIKASEQQAGRQELNRFVQWCGRDRRVAELNPFEIGEYGESAGMWGADSAQKVRPLKSFLGYLDEKGLSKLRLAPHLKVSRAKKGQRRVFLRSSSRQAALSPEGRAALQSRLEMLKEERVKVIGDVSRAMADKDFRENAPLDAAKERQGFIESSIRELEGILANSVELAAKSVGDKSRVRLGRRVTLKDMNSGSKVRYTLVDMREADPQAGKISSVSPVGKALLDRTVGDEVQISVPKGTLRYTIEKVDG